MNDLGFSTKEEKELKAFYKKHMKTLERQRPLCRIMRQKSVAQDYWKSAIAKAMAEMGKR